MENVKTELTDVVKIEYIDPVRAEFTEKNGFISLKYRMEETEAAEAPDAKETQTTEESGEALTAPAEAPEAPEEPGVKTYDRVFLHRCFPNEMSEEYVSVLDRENNEIGIIRSIDAFPEETQTLLRRELNRKYHIYTIKAIRSVNEKFGYSYWKVKDAEGDREFTVRDAYRSITKITADRITVTDVDGNRFEIPSLEALDRRSFKKIELYL